MQNSYQDDSYALHTDLYQINMAKAYWADGIHERRAVFEVYFRKLPFGNGYGVFAGVERMADYLQNFRFSDSDLAYLQDELGYDEEFISYLSTVRFRGTVRAMAEGEIVFANEPLIRIEAALAEAQLIETALLNIVNYQTLIATKASRVKQVIGQQIALEFGTRRAQEMDAAVWGARAAYIGGFDATSNVRAGKRFGIPVAGTHAHAFVQAYPDEYTAFRKYAEHHRDCVFLVDTYDTLQSGVPNAIRVAKEMGDRIRFLGIRLDSGDLAYLSKQARKMLDDAGFTEASIFASNDLDEYTILNLRAQGAKINAWGVGTKLITAYDQPALGAVYKLVAVEDDRGGMRDVIKISGNPEKISTPGMKQVYRIINNETGRSEGDYIALEGEDPHQEASLFMFHPVHTYLSKTVSNFEAISLHHTIMEAGALTRPLPTAEDARKHLARNLPLLWDEYLRSLHPEEYPVDLSPACWKNRMDIMESVKKQRKE
ncbi:nicotinate phosphoribosyltransferase [Paenibacillus swuensis]|uniref:Nicotinate phosphoribosyltransferase n=1 Tax=Paenibacillus swuensis TaxID=1178515 RepID=A0A172TKR2_9BACL|nr:nicotinate phosphoribosyltransferase [Paenibacillus swuensis]ANE47628.1 nicotinate phosphoribosyltransferase [Paenibacillus swuensis]